MKRIPEPIKRRVRQEAGFGCCKCGFPIIEYHHIVRGSDNPQDIMLLCPIHHHEATVGAMTKSEQLFYKANPYNIKRGFIEGQLKVNQNVPVINIGSNQFVGDGDFLIVDGESLLAVSIESRRLQLSMKLYDQKDNLVAEVKNNEWISGDPLPWDLQSKFQWLRIRRKQRDIMLEIDARKFPINVRADIWRKGQNFQLRPRDIIFNGVRSNIGFRNLCFVALRLEADIQKQSFSIVPDPRFRKGMFVSDPDVKKRIKKALKGWNKLVS